MTNGKEIAMKAPMKFLVTNFLGFAEVITVNCQSETEGRKVLDSVLEYPAMNVECLGWDWGF